MALPEGGLCTQVFFSRANSQEALKLPAALPGEVFGVGVGNVASVGAKNWVSGSWEASQEIGETGGGSGASEHWGQEQSSGDPVGFHNSSLSWPLSHTPGQEAEAKGGL